MSELKLIALDSEDLKIISAHLQDAVLKVSDIAYLMQEKRFAALMNRFNWFGNIQKVNSDAPMTRHRTALRIERVIRAQTQGLDLHQQQKVLSLLAIKYEKICDDDPAGHITLFFSGESTIRLTVECIEIELRDLGGVWATPSQPEHLNDMADK